MRSIFEVQKTTRKYIDMRTFIVKTYRELTRDEMILSHHHHLPPYFSEPLKSNFCSLSGRIISVTRDICPLEVDILYSEEVYPEIALRYSDDRNDLDLIKLSSFGSKILGDDTLTKEMKKSFINHLLNYDIIRIDGVNFIKSISVIMSCFDFLIESYEDILLESVSESHFLSQKVLFKEGGDILDIDLGDRAKIYIIKEIAKIFGDEVIVEYFGGDLNRFHFTSKHMGCYEIRNHFIYEKLSNTSFHELSGNDDNNFKYENLIKHIRNLDPNGTQVLSNLYLEIYNSL